MLEFRGWAECSFAKTGLWRGAARCMGCLQDSARNESAGFMLVKYFFVDRLFGVFVFSRSGFKLCL